MRTLLIAALAAATTLAATTADAQSRRSRGFESGAPIDRRRPPPRGFDRYAEPAGGGTITSSTPYPNGNFSNPGGGGGGGNGP